MVANLSHYTFLFIFHVVKCTFHAVGCTFRAVGYTFHAVKHSFERHCGFPAKAILLFFSQFFFFLFKPFVLVFVLQSKLQQIDR